METTFIIYLFLAIYSHADSVAFATSAAIVSTTPRGIPAESITPAISQSDVDTELTRIAESCMTPREHEQLWNNAIKHTLARLYNRRLLRVAVHTIGRTEMRAALGFAPPRSWTHHNYTEPNEHELAESTIETYLDMREPRSKMCSLDSILFYEKNITPAVEYLDARFPFIRAYYRRTFEEICRRNAGVIDKKLIDRVIDEFKAVRSRIDDAFRTMFSNDDYEGCEGK